MCIRDSTRAVMKIQEGCDNRCTYCIIPSVRGGVRSRSLDVIRTEAEALSQAGFQELVLTGIHPVSYTHLDVYKRQSSPCPLTSATASARLPRMPAALRVWKCCVSSTSLPLRPWQMCIRDRAWVSRRYVPKIRQVLGI